MAAAPSTSSPCRPIAIPSRLAEQVQKAEMNRQLTLPFYSRKGEAIEASFFCGALVDRRGAELWSAGQKCAADAGLEAGIGGEGFEEVVFGENVKLQRRARGDCRGDRPLEVRRDHAKSFAEAKLFVENASFGAIGHARADDVEPVALLTFVDDDLAGLSRLD